MLKYQQALNLILKQIKPEIKSRSIEKSVKYICAENIKARENIPDFDNSAMDGYAVRYSDLDKNKKHSILKIAGQSLAGKPYTKTLKKLEAVYITTGAPIPKGADTVIMVENTVKTGKHQVRINISDNLKKYQHIRKIGEDIKKNQVIIKKQTRIRPSEVALLAAAGITKIKVYSPPSFSIISTGSELMHYTVKKLKYGFIRNSNSIMIAKLLEDMNCKVDNILVAKDDEKEIKKIITKSLKSDIIISTGGVSMGESDLIKGVLLKMGLKQVFWKVAVKPGKPLFFGKIKNKLFFGLPGNPVSSFVSFINFVKPAILKYHGKDYKTKIFKARINETFRSKSDRLHFVRGMATYRRNQWFVKSTGYQGSANLSSLTKGNCFIFVPPGNVKLTKGDIVDIVFFDEYLMDYINYSDDKIKKINLTVNNEDIFMNKFVKNALANIINAFVDSLKLKQEIDSIDLKIR